MKRRCKGLEKEECKRKDLSGEQAEGERGRGSENLWGRWRGEKRYSNKLIR